MATGIALGAVALWAFAPVLVFLALLAGALGFACALMIGLARLLQAWQARRDRQGRARR
jgi:hypothetical protein